jgi:hypothetical protein
MRQGWVADWHERGALCQTAGWLSAADGAAACQHALGAVSCWMHESCSLMGAATGGVRKPQKDTQFVCRCMNSCPVRHTAMYWDMSLGTLLGTGSDSCYKHVCNN